MLNPFERSSFLGTLALVLLAIAALFTADTFLAKTERMESVVEAARLFEQGRAFMQKGENAEAVERIKDAISIERGNREYMRALAQAQFAAGDSSGAQSTLMDLLQSDSTDAMASLTMARVLAKEGQFEEAISFFHRAIYGHWNEDAQANRLRVRFELVDLLAQRNSKEELLAELLPIQEDGPQDPKTQIRIGQLFLVAGSPARAADVFRGVLNDAPDNADAHAGLGEAEFARGNYRAAQQSFQVALHFSPNNETARRRLDLCDNLLALDPTMRGLASTERYRRSVKLVELTLDETNQCVADPSPELRRLLDTAAMALEARISASRQGEVTESNLDLAEQLWQARKKECKSPPVADSALGLVLAKVAQ